MTRAIETLIIVVLIAGMVQLNRVVAQTETLNFACSKVDDLFVVPVLNRFNEETLQSGHTFVADSRRGMATCNLLGVLCICGYWQTNRRTTNHA
jgi:hypothetical protein